MYNGYCHSVVRYPPRMYQGADTGFVKGGGGGGGGGRGGALYITRCLRQCIEACSADQSARNFFRLHFSHIRMGSRGTFVLCTAIKFQMSEDCMQVPGPPCASFLLKFRSRT